MSFRVKCNFCGSKFGSSSKSVECPSCGSTDEKDFIFTEDSTPEVPASQMMYEVSYGIDFRGDGVTSRYKNEHVTQKRLDYMVKNEKGYYKDLQVICELGMTDTTWLATWYEIGMKNYWIPTAYDPQFTMGSFSECKTMEQLLTKLGGGGWCLGQAFYYRNLCFINQVNGGDEWLIIKDDVDFESYSAGSVIRRNQYDFVADIYTYLNTPKEKLKRFEYDRKTAPEEIEFDGVIYRDEVKIRAERFKTYYGIVVDNAIEYHADMLERAKMIKDDPEKFVKVLEDSGEYKVDIENFTVTKWYDITESMTKEDGSIDPKRFAFEVKSTEVKGNQVKVTHQLSDFIKNYSIREITWRIS